MSDPVRWSDRAAEVDPELGEVLRYARRQAPGEAQLVALTQRVLGQLPDAASAQVSTSVPEPAPDLPTVGPGGAGAKAMGTPASFLGGGPTLTVALGVKAGAVAICALTCGLGLWGLSRNEGDRASTRPPARALSVATTPGAGDSTAEEISANAAPAAGGTAPAGELRAANAGVASAATDAGTAAGAVKRARMGGARSVQAPPADSASVPDELRLLHRARRVLREQPAAALAVAREHEHRYPNGAFREEREALLVEVLFRTGQETEGRARLHDFRARYPNSAYTARVRKWDLPAP